MEIKEINQILQSAPVLSNWNGSINSLNVDSRNLNLSKNSIFFAIRGDRFDGHDFVLDAYTKGVRNFIVEQVPSAELLVSIGDANLWQVRCSVTALQDLAKYHRTSFDYPVLAITGSNGKTIVKEWLSTLLTPDFQVIKSPKSHNSQIGVPLSVWEMKAHHNLGIFEAGISQVGEMTRLQKVIQPQIGILTNIGAAHNEGFNSQEQKLIEKISLFKTADLIFTSADQPWILDQIKDIYPTVKLVTWSLNNLGDVNYQKSANQNSIQVSGTFGEFEVSVSQGASFFLENVAASTTVALHLGISISSIQERIQVLADLQHRFSLKKGLNGSHLLDDSYSNDLTGLKAAISYLASFSYGKSKSVILSDLPAQEKDKAYVYSQVSKTLNEFNIDRLYGIGNDVSTFLTQFSGESIFFDSTDSFISSLPSFDKESILIKGSRSYQFEKIVSRLEERNHETILELQMDNVVKNLNFYKGNLSPDTKIMVMVKASAYGSGIVEIAHLLQYHRVDYLGVAYLDEGIELRKNGIHIPIMVMNPVSDRFDLLEEYQLEAEIFRIDQLEFILKFYPRVKFHLKMNVGMNRLGFDSSSISNITQLLSRYPQCLLVGIFGHLSSSDSLPDNAYNLNQINLFKEMVHPICQVLATKPLCHLLNSSGMINYPSYQLDMVRLGIGLYGYEPTGKFQKELLPVGILKTVISQIRNVRKGESIGYSRMGIASEDMRLGVIPIGYADGYLRVFGNGRGKVLIGKTLRPTIGNICMDMCMIDLGEVNANEGDEVIIFGDNPTIADLASWADTIPYEILTNISGRVKRVYRAE